MNNKKLLQPPSLANCASCIHYIKPDKARIYTDTGQGVCFKGGFSEIGDPYIQRSKENCNAFELNGNIYKLPKCLRSLY